MRVRRKACVVSSCLWQRSTSNCSWIGPQNRSVSVNYLSCGCEPSQAHHIAMEVIPCQWWTLLAADGADGRKERTGRTHVIYNHTPSYPWSCGHSPETSRQKISHFGPAQHSLDLRLLLETSFDQTLAAVGSTRAGRPPLPFSKPKHQPTTNPGPAPGRAAGPVGLRSTR